MPEHDDYGFNMDEVDYNEGEDEEMDQEEETQQDDEIIEEDEDDEMNIEEEKEPEVKLPAWAQNLTPGGKGLPGHGLVNNDVSEAAAYLYDNIIVSKLISMFKYYYDQRIVMTPQAAEILHVDGRGEEAPHGLGRLLHVSWRRF